MAVTASRGSDWIRACTISLVFSNHASKASHTACASSSFVFFLRGVILDSMLLPVETTVLASDLYLFSSTPSRIGSRVPSSSLPFSPGHRAGEDSPWPRFFRWLQSERHEAIRPGREPPECSDSDEDGESVFFLSSRNCLDLGGRELAVGCL